MSHAGQIDARLTPALFERIACIARREAGLELRDTKLGMVQSRLYRHLRRGGHGSIDAFLEAVERDRTMRQQLISVLTTNVTGFFREPHHFDLLATEMRAKSPDATDRIRIWSAGCSGGQEPYSIAITLCEVWPDLPDRNVLILGTDIDTQVLARARRGVYSDHDVTGIEGHRLERHFRRGAPTREGDECQFAVEDHVRASVRFNQLNLNSPWPMSGKFDVIFCRNVMIYFDAATQASLWPRFRDALVPGGLLCIGHSERIDPLGGSGFVAAGVTSFRKAAA